MGRRSRSSRSSRRRSAVTRVLLLHHIHHHLIHHHLLLRQLLFAALLGMLFLLAADILARALMQPYELPVGTLLAAVGAPALIAIVLRGGFRALLSAR